MKSDKKRLILAALGLAALAVFFLLPKLQTAYLRTAIETEFAAKFDASGHSETFSETYFENVTLKKQKTGLLILEAEKIRIKTGLFGRLNFGDLRRRIHFEKPVLHLRKDKAGSWNWLPAFNASSGTIEEAKERPTSLAFNDGKIRYLDASQEPAASFEVNFTSAEFSFKKGGLLNGAVRITGSKAIPGVILLGFTYDTRADSLTFQLSSSDTKLLASGTVQDFSTDFYTQFSAKSSLKEMILVSPRKIGFAGLLTLEAEGNSRGSHPESFLKFLSLKGALDVRHGTLLRENILRQILRGLKPVGSLSLPPGKNGTLPDYHGLIGGADTAFQALQTHLEVSNGLLRFEEFRLKDSEYYLEGEGAFDFPNEKMDFRARFVLLEKLSAWFIEKNSAFKAFENENGRLVLPFLYRGLAPDIELEMDWDRISEFVKNKEIKEAAEKQRAEGAANG